MEGYPSRCVFAQGQKPCLKLAHTDWHQETATLLWLSLDALAVLGHPKASWEVLGCPRTAKASKDSQSKVAVS